MKKMISTTEAMELVLEHTHPLSPTVLPIADSLSLSLAEDIISDGNYPPFNRAVMDGYAVHSADAGKSVQVLGEVAASTRNNESFPLGSCIEIMTGAPCPPGTEAVVKREDTLRTGESVSLPADIVPGQFIAAEGSEFQVGSLLLRSGAVITPLVIANLATFGIKTVKVFPYPSMVVITTGNELVEVGEKVGDAQIRDSNGPMIVAMAESYGISKIVRSHADDTFVSLERVLEKTVGADIVIFTGGVSAGNYDIVPEALSRFGVETIFHKVTQKPGKPLLFGKKSSQLFFGLPGNPLSSYLCFNRYITAAINKMIGKPITHIYHTGKLTSPLRVAHSNRTQFILAHAEMGDDGWQVTQLNTKGSADIFTACSANSYITLPPGAHHIGAGSPIEFMRIGEH